MSLQAYIAQMNDSSLKWQQVLEFMEKNPKLLLEMLPEQKQNAVALEKAERDFDTRVESPREGAMRERDPQYSVSPTFNSKGDTRFFTKRAVAPR
jgi:hypothetical protein